MGSRSPALRMWGPRTRSKTRVFDSGHSTIHGVRRRLTGVAVVGSPYTLKSLGLGTLGSLTVVSQVVSGVGHSRECLEVVSAGEERTRSEREL